MVTIAGTIVRMAKSSSWFQRIPSHVYFVWWWDNIHKILPEESNNAEGHPNMFCTVTSFLSEGSQAGLVRMAKHLMLTRGIHVWEFVVLYIDWPYLCIWLFCSQNTQWILTKIEGKMGWKFSWPILEGFVRGVDRAIKIVDLSLKTYGAPSYIRHEIVDGRHVVESLRGKGVIS